MMRICYNILLLNSLKFTTKQIEILGIAMIMLIEEPSNKSKKGIRGTILAKLDKF